MVQSCLMHRAKTDTPQPCCLPPPTKGWTKLVPATQLPSPHAVSCTPGDLGCSQVLSEDHHEMAPSSLQHCPPGHRTRCMTPTVGEHNLLRSQSLMNTRGCAGRRSRSGQPHSLPLGKPAAGCAPTRVRTLLCNRLLQGASSNKKLERRKGNIKSSCENRD